MSGAERGLAGPVDDGLAEFARRWLDDGPYLTPDARYERVREAGVIRN